jgi:UTRA domain
MSPGQQHGDRGGDADGDGQHAEGQQVSLAPAQIRAPALCDGDPEGQRERQGGDQSRRRAARADEKHAAAPAGDEIAAARGVSPGSPVLLTRTRHYTVDGKLIEYAETMIPAGHWHTRAYTITGN